VLDVVVVPLPLTAAPTPTRTVAAPSASQSFFLLLGLVSSGACGFVKVLVLLTVLLFL
jgi:hypothetical protein